MDIIPFISSLPDVRQQQWIDDLNNVFTDQQFVLSNELSLEEKLHSNYAVVANPERVQFEGFENLQWVQSLWAGVENLVPLAREKKFQIIRLIDPCLTIRMSLSVLTWTLFLHQNIAQYRQQQNKKLWLEIQPIQPCSRTISILGLGELGQASAKRLIDNGFNVLGWSKSPKIIKGVTTFSGHDGLIKLLAQTHILINLLPLTDGTKGLLNKNIFDELTPGASLINFARGAIIDDTDLLNALDSGHLNHAVLDTFTREPLPRENPYWQHPSVTVLPHVAASTNPQTAIEIVRSNISHILKEQNFKAVLSARVDLHRGY